MHIIRARKSNSVQIYIYRNCYFCKLEQYSSMALFMVIEPHMFR